MLALPPSESRATDSSEDITPRSALVRTHSPILCGSPLLRPLASLEESVQVATSPCCPSRTFPTLFLRIVPMMPEPLPRRSTECLCLVLPQCHWPSLIIDRSAFLMFRERDFPRVRFETAAISLCSGLTVCSPHRSLPPLQFPLQGGRDFYIRAKRVSLPPHASDMLSVQLQAIDGTRTLTSPDSQPCRLLPIIPYAVKRSHTLFLVSLFISLGDGQPESNPSQLAKQPARRI